MTAPRVLLAVSSVPPHPDRNGYTLRVHHLLHELARDWRIVLLAPRTDGAGRDLRDDLEAWVEVPESGVVPDRLGPDRVAAGYVDAVSSALERWTPDVVLLWGGTEFLASRIEGLPPAVGDRIDSSTLAAWRNRYRGLNPRQHLRSVATLVGSLAYERRALRRLEAVVVVGEDDAGVLRRVVGRRPVHVVPNGVAVPPPGQAQEGEAERPTVAFTGVLAFPPNIDAARWFARSAWARVRERVPDARFVIAGRHAVPEILALREEPGVEVRQDVPDMVTFLRTAWVAVAPMRSGSGIKNKVLEAWAAGRPVVMTSMATNGLGLAERERLLVTDDPVEMADRVVALLEDPVARKAAGRDALERARSRHGWDRSAAALGGILESVAEREGR